jgi:hypothetical protein
VANFLLSYDVKSTNPEPYSALIAQLSKVGWSAWIWGAQPNKWLHLPNTTFVGSFANYSTAKKAFDDAVAAAAKDIKISVHVEKWIIAEYSTASYGSDKTRT